MAIDIRKCWKYGAGAVLALLIVGWGACRLTDSYSRAKGRYEEAERTVERERGERAKERAAWEREAAALERANAAMLKERNAALSTIADKDAELAALRASEPVRPDLEREPLVVNLRAQIRTLSDQFTLAQGVIARDEQIIWNLRQEITAKDALIASWRKDYEDEARLRSLADGLVHKAEARLRTSRLTSRIVTLALVGAGGYAIYRTIKK